MLEIVDDLLGICDAKLFDNRVIMICSFQADASMLKLAILFVDGDMFVIFYVICGNIRSTHLRLSTAWTKRLPKLVHRD